MFGHLLEHLLFFFFCFFVSSSVQLGDWGWVGAERGGCGVKQLEENRREGDRRGRVGRGGVLSSCMAVVV